MALRNTLKRRRQDWKSDGPGSEACAHVLGPFRAQPSNYICFMFAGFNIPKSNTNKTQMQKLEVLRQPLPNRDQSKVTLQCLTLQLAFYVCFSVVLESMTSLPSWPFTVHWCDPGRRSECCCSATIALNVFCMHKSYFFFLHFLSLSNLMLWRF